jgi:TonB family protein
MKTSAVTVPRIIIVLVFGFLIGQLVVGQNRDETVTDDQISVSSFAEMHYPRMAQVAHIRGMVVIRVKLDEAGRVVSSVAVSGSKVLIPDTLANAKKWRFLPNAAKSAVIVYEFLIPEGVCDPNEKSGQGDLFIFRKPNIASITACPLIAQP